ncbi:hypothetical protein [Aurantibacillus circumpalustris]|uniref:hypothetical protein n=1 Tax=Aurantibacillus circumpalustris TaxID=3036359 RepID=UPI00295B2CDC|nr:hypothetical protein [Aurantibacillus circumpalustris]
MKNILFILILLDFVAISVSAQTQHKHEYSTRYTQKQMLDSCEGVLIYYKMMWVLKLDYELLSEQGSVVQGWNEEYFDNGQLMHISYYKEGKLVLFKNFFENGQCEHYITYTDPQNCNIDVYFESGGLKNQIHFNNNLPERMTEFFSNGLPKSQIEFDQKANCVSSKRVWFLNAELQSELLIIDIANKKYSDKSFYPNGLIKEEGELIYSIENKEYIKTGVWQIFESNGKKKSTEKFKFTLSSN